MGEARERTANKYILIILIVFGTYLSVLYYGHQQVPNPDFTAFFETGSQLLSLHLPDNYKRVPVLGILQVALSKFTGGSYPDLRAGWILNACLLPMNLVLLWFVGQRIVGRAAPFIALIVVINPWVLQMVMHPIAETLLLFCILLSFYAIFRRSRWAYLAASVTTMVRYEGALIILIIFVIDMMEREKGDSWVKPFLFAALASVPLCLWLLGTLLNLQTQGSTFYLKEMGATSGGKIVWKDYLRLIWYMGVQNIFETDVFAPKMMNNLAARLSKSLSLLSFIYGVGFGIFKRNWNVFALAVFLSGYLLIHSVHAAVLPRFGVPVFWIVLLICVYGMKNGWACIYRNNSIFEKAVWVMQGLAFILITVWLFYLVLHVPETTHISRRSISVPYVFCGFAALLFFTQTQFCRKQQYLKTLTITLLIILIAFSNQFQLVKVVKDGKEDIEFKLLAEWYLENAKPGETMLSSGSNLVQIFAPSSKDAFIHIYDLKADNRVEFIKACYEKRLDYVTWDSRIGFRPTSRYGVLWKVKNIKELEMPRDSRPFIFVNQIWVSEKQFINIFRLKERL